MTERGDPIQETDNDPPVPILLSAFVATLIGMLLGSSTWLVLEWITSGERASYSEQQVAPTSEVSADPDRPSGTAQSVRARQHAALHKYAWADRERGLVQIPIDVAIALELEEETQRPTR